MDDEAPPVASPADPSRGADGPVVPELRPRRIIEPASRSAPSGAPPRRAVQSSDPKNEITAIVQPEPDRPDRSAGDSDRIEPAAPNSLRDRSNSLRRIHTQHSGRQLLTDVVFLDENGKPVPAPVRRSTCARERRERAAARRAAATISRSASQTWSFSPRRKARCREAQRTFSGTSGNASERSRREPRPSRTRTR